MTLEGHKKNIHILPHSLYSADFAPCIFFPLVPSSTEMPSWSIKKKSISLSLVENLGRLSRLQLLQEQRYPFVFLCVWLQVFGIFNVRRIINACTCVQGLYGHRNRVCTESRPWEEKPLPHQGLEPASALCLAFQLAQGCPRISAFLVVWAIYIFRWVD